eukprot:5272081-Pleurochrysis_carterae.AAC.2
MKTPTDLALKVSSLKGKWLRDTCQCHLVRPGAGTANLLQSPHIAGDTQNCIIISGASDRANTSANSAKKSVLAPSNAQKMNQLAQVHARHLEYKSLYLIVLLLVIVLP